jgi:hypothetical protein
MISKSLRSLVWQLYAKFLMSRACLLWSKFQWLLVRALLVGIFCLSNGLVRLT